MPAAIDSMRKQLLCFVVIELLKSFSYSGDKANLTYYRDSNAKEIDVIVEENGLVHPLEIKKSANPDRREIKKYEVLDKTTLERDSGGIVCMCEEVIPIDQKTALFLVILYNGHPRRIHTAGMFC